MNCLKHSLRAAALTAVMLLTAFGLKAERFERYNVVILYERLDDGAIRVTDVWNNNKDTKLYLHIDNGKAITINGNGSDKPGRTARKRVSFDVGGRGGTVWTYSEPKREEAPRAEEPAPSAAASAAQTAVAEQPQTAVRERTGRDSEERASADRQEVSVAPAPIPVSYAERLDRDSFFGSQAVEGYIRFTNELTGGLQASKEKKQFLIDHDVAPFVAQSRKDIEAKRAEIPDVARELVAGVGGEAGVSEAAVNMVSETLTSRLRQREDALAALERAIAETGAETESDGPGAALYIVIAVLLLLAVGAFLFVRRRGASGKAASAEAAKAAAVAAKDDGSIVVRRKTGSVLKKQSLDDVRDNPAYLEIDAASFAEDSAVRRIYVKNSCIREVYNLYAEDLRNPENPKEDGCMVLGRWVLDETDGTYDVSLEEVVLPGDDAVFKEYELNFGGKIKLRVAERLRKLRRDTGLQYDLVCWIHSHPGLGVFFSNSDVSVQAQLKHAQHPNFLTAFVVDILTSDQETGIFTFRRDGTMNSKTELKRMFSLEEMYKWALESERAAYSPANCFDVLAGARERIRTCCGVELNNNAIIDLTQIADSPETGIVGWAIGTPSPRDGGLEYIVTGMTRGAVRPAAGATGCLVSLPEANLTTLRLLVDRELKGLSFIMVYSSRRMTLTTIPVTGGELPADGRLYSDVKLDDLKIWTRRKR